MLHAIVGLFALVAGVSAHAYIPPSFFVIRSIAKKHAVVEEGRFRHKVTFYKSNGDVLKTLSETVLMTDSDNAIVQLSDENGNPVATRTRKLVGTRTDEINRPVTYDLLLMKDGANIFSHLRQLGLPLKTEGDLYAEKEGALPYKPESTVALVRYDRRLAIVVSDSETKSASDVKTPQLWVEKDSFLPLRAVFPSAPEAGVSSEPLEFKFSGYQVYKGLLYPRVMQIYRRGELWVKAETQEVQLTAGSRPEIKNNADIDGNVKDALEMYFKWVR